jgi:alkyldihydroxyacetonephosphate synthase
VSGIAGGRATHPLAAAPAAAAEAEPPRFWGWGPDAGGRPALAPAVRALLRRALGVDRDAPPRVRIEEAGLRPSRLAEGARRSLEAAVGDGGVAVEEVARIRHAAGKSYEDLVRLRAGDVDSAPDGVVRPGSHEEVAAVLAVCAAEGIAVVPVGGGTSVVGGVEPERGRFDAVVALDLARLGRMLALEPRSLTATFEAGVTGPVAETLLDQRGLTLGHFPQSFEYATIGGYVATRSAGQASTGYGRIDDLVLGLRCATPAGELRVDPVPASAAGPSLLELLVGSEGTLGVITEATLAVHARPERRCYEGWSFPSFEAGAEALRTLVQAGAAPDVARLSDAGETGLALAQSAAGGGLGARALGRYLALRSQGRPCLAIVGWEGSRSEVGRRRAHSRHALRGSGGLALGPRPGVAWARSRFDGPYLRDDLLDLGILAETLETATSWDRVASVHDAVTAALHAALGERGTPPLVGCHISHLYRSGASLYFTVLARQEHGAELEQWRAAKRAASEAIVAGGATITHHHGVGVAHLPWMDEESGALGREALRAVKDRLDPTGIMNPGKLLA